MMSRSTGKLLSKRHKLPIIRRSSLNISINLVIIAVTRVAFLPSSVSEQLHGWVSVDVLTNTKIALSNAVDASNVKVGRVFEVAVGLG